MPVVCDFEVVQGSSVHVGDRGGPYWSGTFNTGGRRSSGLVLIMYEHNGIQESDNSLWLNGKKLYNIEKSREKGYRVDIGTFPASKLQSGSNTLEIRAAAATPGTGRSRYDDFDMKNIVVFFHQRA
ncbi:MAG: hypothetical protein JSW60_09180 [Thermoplasmatales archaeon]|nr:MAG: hypothetical protein JSW60_09180 [Thermoplasmatales archaeon]